MESSVLLSFHLKLSVPTLTRITSMKIKFIWACCITWKCNCIQRGNYAMQIIQTLQIASIGTIVIQTLHTTPIWLLWLEYWFRMCHIYVYSCIILPTTFPSRMFDNQVSFFLPNKVDSFPKPINRRNRDGSACDADWYSYHNQCSRV